MFTFEVMSDEERIKRLEHELQKLYWLLTTGSDPGTVAHEIELLFDELDIDEPDSLPELE